MYGEKPRYVHLNVKRTNIGKYYYVKNSACGFIRWDESSSDRALILSCILFQSKKIRESLFYNVKLNFRITVKINVHKLLSECSASKFLLAISHGLYKFGKLEEQRVS